MKFLEALGEFITEENLSGMQAVQTLKRILAEREERDLLNETKKAQKRLGILDGQRLDTFYLAIAEEIEEEEENEEKET